MKKTVVLSFALTLGMSVAAATIEQVIVRQQWPWSTDVKVEYKLSGVTAPVDLSLKTYNGDTELTLPAAAITGDRYGISEDGVGTLTIDPVAAFGTGKIALANFKVKLSVSDSAANIHDVIYRIVDLTNGHVDDLSRADFYNNRGYGAFVTNYADIHAGFTTDLSPEDVFIWTGVTNDVAYKTTKMVLRRIPAKNQVFPYGTARCTLTNDYWMGVFDLTYEQYKTLTGSYAGQYTTLEGFEVMPISGLAFKNYNNTVVPSLNARVPTIAFGFSSEARLAFALRGGKHDDANNWHGATGKGLVAWHKENSDVGSGTQPHAVGTKLPNAYGLYDAIGNVNQVVWDTNSSGSLPTEDVVDPILSNGSNRVSRGGAFNYKYPSTEYRSEFLTFNNANPTVGYRPYADAP